MQHNKSIVLFASRVPLSIFQLFHDRCALIFSVLKSFIDTAPAGGNIKFTLLAYGILYYVIAIVVLHAENTGLR